MKSRKVSVVILAIMIAALAATKAMAWEIIPSFKGEVYRTLQAKWTQDVMSFYEKLHYDMEVTAFTKISGSFCDKSTGLGLGANLNIDDNEIGKANNYRGYLGIKQIFLRLETGKMKGTAVWSGGLALGQTSRTPFENKLTHVDMIIKMKKFINGSGYWGAGYTTFAIPAELQTLKVLTNGGQQYEGVRAFDPDFQIKCYSLIFGFDTFSENMTFPGLAEEKQPKWEGFSFFASGEDRIGLGNSQISATGIRAAEFLNPGKTAVGEKFFTALVENDTNMGFKWGHDFGKIRTAIGLGYEVSFVFTLAYGGMAKTTSDLGFDVPISILRHGPIARVLVGW